MEDLTGKQLGPYRVVAPLGEGGMAAVYKAYQPAMDRYVALKILPRHFASDPQFVARFQQEAKVLANLQHPHILPVFDFGESDGYTYIVMPFVSSGTLTDLLKDQPLPLPRIRVMISQLGDALDYAHARGLVHRDVKPSNVLLDERGNCLLTDFGLAKLVESAIHLTVTGGIIGTPAYMSPEQGLGQQLDGRSDLYSLGVILYEMATGRAPFKAETPMAVVIKHINDPLPPPRSVNPALPEAVERVILKTLAKDPADRYATGGDFVHALQAAIPEPVRAAAEVWGAPAPAAAPPTPPMPPTPPPVVEPAYPTPATEAPPPSEVKDRVSHTILDVAGQVKEAVGNVSPEAAAAIGGAVSPQHAEQVGSVVQQGVDFVRRTIAEIREQEASPTHAKAKKCKGQPPRQADEEVAAEAEAEPAPPPVSAAPSIFLIALGWAAALGVGFFASRLAGENALILGLVTGGLGGLSIGLSLRRAGNVNLALVIVNAILWAAAGVALIINVWIALGALALAAFFSSVLAGQAQPALGGGRRFAVAGGWIVGVVSGGLTAAWLVPSLGLVGFGLAGALGGAVGGGLMFWQIDQTRKQAGRREPPAPAGRPWARRKPGRRGCVSPGCLPVLIILVVVGYRAARAVFPAQDCYTALEVGVAKTEADPSRWLVVAIFKTSDKIVPVVKNTNAWLTSCGPVTPRLLDRDQRVVLQRAWHAAPFQTAAEASERLNLRPGNAAPSVLDAVVLQNVHTPLNVYGNFNPYQNLPPGRYMLEFWYQDILLTPAINLTILPEPDYQPPDCVEMLKFWAADNEEPEGEPQTKFVEYQNIFPIVESGAICTDTVKARLLDANQKMVVEQEQAPLLARTSLGNYNTAGLLEPGAYKLEFWYGAKRLRVIDLAIAPAPKPTAKP